MADENKKRTRKPRPPRNDQNKSKPPNKDKFEWKKATRTLTFWVLIILGSIIISQLYSGKNQGRVDIPYTEFVVLMESGQVSDAIVVDREFHGTLRSDAMRELPGGVRTFVTILPPTVDSEMLEQWDKYGINYSFKEKSTNWFGYLLTSILPWIILIGIWILLMRRMQGGGPKGIFSFGKSRAKLLTENRPKITFEDVAGADEAKEEVQEIIEFLKDPKKFQRLGGRIPRGALLLGPPGTGKTLLAKAIAGEADVPFFSMSGADFVEMFVGVGAARVRDLFEQGKKSAPCIIFIDEIDAVGRQRGAGLGGGHDEREQTLNQLLVEMDGFDSNEGVILVAATNRPDVLDPALLRPGRFDRQIVVDRPDVRGREGILKVHCRKIPLGRDVSLETIAKGTPGLSGADLENIVNESALVAAKRDANKVEMIDFEAAKDKIMMGMERKSLIISDQEKKNTAYHEAGHVLVAKLTPGSDPVHKVTIIPRGRALGLTHLLPIDEKHNYSRSYLEAMLTHLLGGRAAESIVLNDFTTGAGNDIERATALARKMVCEWGMSEKLGPMTFGKKEEEIFLGREIAKHRDYSEETAIAIDHEVRVIIEAAQKRAEGLIKKHIEKLHAIAKALLDREILDGHEIDLLLDGKKLKPIRKPAPRRKKPFRAKNKPKAAVQPKESEVKSEKPDDPAKKTPPTRHRNNRTRKHTFKIKPEQSTPDKSESKTDTASEIRNDIKKDKSHTDPIIPKKKGSRAKTQTPRTPSKPNTEKDRKKIDSRPAQSRDGFQTSDIKQSESERSDKSKESLVRRESILDPTDKKHGSGQKKEQTGISSGTVTDKTSKASSQQKDIFGKDDKSVSGTNMDDSKKTPSFIRRQAAKERAKEKTPGNEGKSGGDNKPSDKES